MLGAVAAAPAQLAITQPTEKLLVLPLAVASPADSAASVATMDLARERLTALARYKVLTVPKAKICEALQASGFTCDILLAEQQASQLARSLSVNAYTTGLLSRNSASYTAKIRISEGSSGFGMVFTATRSTPQILGEAIGQRLNNIVRAAEGARDGREQRYPGDAALTDLGIRCATEGSLWQPASDLYQARLEADTALPHDSTFLRGAIAVNQAIPDTTRLLNLSRLGARSFPRSKSFAKQLGAAYELAGKIDSAIIMYQHAYRMDTTDVSTGLLVAKTMLDHIVLDTARFNSCQRAKDTTCLRLMGTAFANRVDSVRLYLQPGTVSPDSNVRVNAAAIMLQGSSKIAQAQAYDRAYPWLDQLLNLVAPRSPADTVGPRQAIRVQTSFWFGLSSTLSLLGPYTIMTKAPASIRCDQAKDINDRIQRTKQALFPAGKVAPP